jgi:hypothetical protein
MHIARTCLLASLAASIVGCAAFAASQPGTPEWFQAQRASMHQRASFDLSCPEKELKFVPLGDSADGFYANGNYTTIGAAGCGQKATYVHIDGKWVMSNSSTGPTEPGAPPVVSANNRL